MIFHTFSYIFISVLFLFPFSFSFSMHTQIRHQSINQSGLFSKNALDLMFGPVSVYPARFHLQSEENTVGCGGAFPVQLQALRPLLGRQGSEDLLAHVSNNECES